MTGLIPELAKVFSTKTRAPYMVPLQTMLLSEVKDLIEGTQSPVAVATASNNNNQEEDHFRDLHYVPSSEEEEVKQDPVPELSRHSSAEEGGKWENIDRDDIHPLDGLISDPPFKILW